MQTMNMKIYLVENHKKMTRVTRFEEIPQTSYMKSFTWKSFPEKVKTSHTRHF